MSLSKLFKNKIKESCNGGLIFLVGTVFKTRLAISHYQHEHQNSPYILVNTPRNVYFLVGPYKITYSVALWQAKFYLPWQPLAAALRLLRVPE